MNNMKIYKDCKELPIWNYKRIIQTEDFFYMIKGYESGDTINADQKELEEKFNDVVKDFALSMNAMHTDILRYGKIEQCKLKITSLILIQQIIGLQIKSNIIREKEGLKIDNSIVDVLLENVKIQKAENLFEQFEIIEKKIQKLQNDINEAEAKLKKDNPEEEQKEYDIDEVILKTGLALEMQIDEQKTTLYQLGLYQKEAKRRAEHLMKLNSEKKR